MADINSLPYFVYSLMTLASHDVPTTDPALRAWQPDPPVNEAWDQEQYDFTANSWQPDPPVNEAWDQEQYDFTANYPPMTRFPEEDADFPTAYTDEYKEIYPTDPPPNEDEVYFDRRRQNCPTNAHFDQCGAHPLCQQNCDNYPKPIPCTMACISGCICDEGFIRGPDNECIRPESCPAKPNADQLLCPRHEHFDICGAHPLCQQNCDNYPKPIPCTVCVKGCICDKGYIRSRLGGRCIPTERCPAKPNAEGETVQPFAERDPEYLSRRRVTKVDPDEEDQDERYPRHRVDPDEEYQTEQYPGKLNSVDCPISPACSRKCKLQGYKWGICTGPEKLHCQCYRLLRGKLNRSI